MSSLRGEQALKDGLSFEFTWTARYLIEVLEERALAIQLGGFPGESGVDFRVEFPNHEEHHQVKRAYGTSGEWKLSHLDDAGVLADFRDRLADSRVHCHFVSSISAVQLRYLADRARSAVDMTSYRMDYLTGDYAKWFSNLVHRWNLPEEECWSRLQRVHPRVMDDLEIVSSSLSMLQSSVEGDPQDVWVHLKDYCFSHLNQPQRASDLWQWLGTKGFKRQVYPGSKSIGAAIAAQTGSYLSRIRGMLIKPQFSRKISETITHQLTAAKTGMDLVVIGAPGGGKSAVMLEVTDSCLKKGWPVLAFRLDELSADCTEQQLQAALNLPVPPAQAISLAAAGRPALVVIDQLDAVSEYSGRTSVLFDRVAKLIQEIRGHRLRSPIHVLIACRDIDWKQDGRFKQLHRPLYGEEIKDEAFHLVEGLTNEEIDSILKNCGLDAATFSPRQYDELLRRPQYLALFIETDMANDEISKIVTPKHLFDAYWRKKERAMAQALPGASTNHWNGILKLITNHLSETASKLSPPQGKRHRGSDDAPLAVAASVLDDFPRTSTDWLISNGVIIESGGRVRFGHESLFDYCFARFFEERGQSLLEYLCAGDQTLIQRGQLRQVMAYLRDDAPEAYVATAKELLDCDEIRPHLKLLLMVILCSVPDPSDTEWSLISSYIDSAMKDFDEGNTTTLACHMFNAFYGSLPLFEKSVDEGAFEKWLLNSGPVATHRLFRILLKHQECAQQKVWGIISPLLGNERFNKPIEWLSEFCKASESRETFDWLLVRMKKGFEDDDKIEHRWSRFYTFCNDLEKNKPSWLTEWIAALIDARANLDSAGGGEFIRDHAFDAKDIQSVSKKCPREFVEQILPAVIRASELRPKPEWISWNGARKQRDGSGYVSADDVLFDSLTSSLVYMIHEDLAFACSCLERLAEVDSTVCRTVLAAVLCHDHSACVSMVIRFLTKDAENFNVSYRGQLAVCEMITVHAARFSDEQMADVEAVILNYYPSWQNGYGYRARTKKGERPSCDGTSRGYQQMTILRSFPEECLSGTATDRLRELERKFDYRLKNAGERRYEGEVKESIVKHWKPQRFFDAITAKEKRAEWNRWRFDRYGLEITDLLRQAVKAQPSAFIEHLESRPLPLMESYVKIVAQELMSVRLEPSLALRGADALRKNEIGLSYEHLNLLAKVPVSELPDSKFEEFLVYLTESSVPDFENFRSNTKRSDLLHSAAIKSLRGQAIGVLVRWIWDDPDIVPKISAQAENWMRDSNPAIRAEMASLCYAIAFKEQNRSLSQKLFTIIVTDSLPEIEVLASHWPWKYMKAGLVEDWDFVKPIINRMTRSDVSEVRASGASLACIGLLRGHECYELANTCVTSNDANVRKACAAVAGHNLHETPAKYWMRETFLTLANDTDNDVCRTIGQAFNSSRIFDFGQIEVLLSDYVKTRAFLLSPSALIRGLEKSSRVLPRDVFEIVRSFILRLNEPSDSSGDQLGYHVGSVISLLKRLYYENRDGALRREALDLIDELCLQGSLAADSLDQ